jgi:hypothetical protein
LDVEFVFELVVEFVAAVFRSPPFAVAVEFVAAACFFFLGGRS